MGEGRMKKKKAPVKRRESEFAKGIGEKLKSIRLSRGHTQVVLSRKACITPACLSQIEAGLRCPSLPVIYRLTKALNCTLARVMPKDKK